ncbi:MAG TPA: lysophospholipid acyltransferase family protein [Pyrinomonadaceae bacterium]|nr:lysophospholipid acyltransferase family protein [Pyrinomonadaceae bacterium]
MRSSQTSARPSKVDSSVLPQATLDLIRPVVGWMGRGFWDLKQRGLENIPAAGGLIIAANHQSYLDPFLISIPVPRPLRFLAWNEALEWPLAGKMMKLMGAWPLHLQGSDLAAIRRSIQWLRDGGALVIFPEGGRGLPNGSMVRFKGGAVRLALEAGVPILPVTIRGANRVWPAGKLVPRMGQIEVVYHPLHQVIQREGEETRECARRESDELAKIIKSAL